MHIGVIIGIVIGILFVLFLVIWLAISIYTWHKLNKLNPHLPRVSIDPKEYAGKWYEIASVPSWFEKGCSHTTAEYTVEQNRIKVTNKCIRNGKHDVANGYAYPTKHYGVLGVSFFPGIYGNYTVVYRDTKTSIVSDPERNYMWILSRDKQITKSKTLHLMAWLKKHHFDSSRLVFTKH